MITQCKQKRKLLFVSSFLIFTLRNLSPFFLALRAQKEPKTPSIFRACGRDEGCAG
jgi:hypothetical protein